MHRHATPDEPVTDLPRHLHESRDTCSGKRGFRRTDTPSVKAASRRRSVSSQWEIVCERAGFEDVRLHDCRHSVASHAVMAGENLPLVGQMLGHRRHATTAGYAHLADAMAARPSANP